MTMNEYIINANNIFISLKDNIDNFEKEAIIIDELKCHLINFRNLDDFSYPGCDVYDTSVGYEIHYEGLMLSIEVEDGMIVNYSY